jgi:hypothetical protein
MLKSSESVSTSVVTMGADYVGALGFGLHWTISEVADHPLNIPHL